MPNQQIGPYLIQSHLGSGGMSDVYLAWDTVNRWPVALKLLRAAPGKQAKLVKRTEREAAVLMKLRHRHIVQIYNAGQTPEGYYYIAMEYVSGGDLYNLMRRKPGAKLPAVQAVYLMRRVAGAIAYAHEQGVVHRDLKPANILLRGDNGEPVITDLGIAAFAGANPLTGTMESLGTPQYMAPEQASGQGKADGRADVYAIGVMLYELLTGRLPFDAENNWAILLRKQQEAAPPVLAARPDLDPQLAAVVEACLQRDPASRYQSAADLAAALDALLPADAGPPPPLPVKKPRGARTPSGAPISGPGATGPGTTPSPSNPTPTPTGNKRRPSALLWAGGGALALLLLLALVIPNISGGGGERPTATVKSLGGAVKETPEKPPSSAQPDPTSTSAGTVDVVEDTPTSISKPAMATATQAGRWATVVTATATRTMVPATATPTPIVTTPTIVVDGDTDGDNVRNSVDQCPFEFQGSQPDPNRPGCPLDSDGDGLYNEDDSCVHVPAGPNDNPSSPGCPPDSDNDGWLDHDDECPNENAGLNPDPNHPGCPMPPLPLDSDGDGVPDNEDWCPYEHSGGYANPDWPGCPPSYP